MAGRTREPRPTGANGSPMSREAARGRYDPPARLSSRGCPATTGANRRRRRGAPGHRRGPAAHSGYEGRGASTGSLGDQRTLHPLIIEAVPAVVRWLAKRHDVTSHANLTNRSRKDPWGTLLASGASREGHSPRLPCTPFLRRRARRAGAQQDRVEHRASGPPPNAETPAGLADGGSSPLTCYHERLTNSVDVPESQGPDLIL